MAKKQTVHVADKVRVALKKYQYNYIVEVLGISRIHFWRRMRDNTFSPEQVAKLKKAKIIS